MTTGILIPLFLILLHLQIFGLPEPVPYGYKYFLPSPTLRPSFAWRLSTAQPEFFATLAADEPFYHDVLATARAYFGEDDAEITATPPVG